MPGKKIAFATSNFNQEAGRPSEGPWSQVPYAELNAERSSKFNGLPIPYTDKVVITSTTPKKKAGVGEWPPSPINMSQSSFIDVRLYDNNDMQVYIPSNNEGEPDVQYTLLGNENSFPVGPGTEWVEVDYEFLLKLFWRVKSWRASVSGGLSWGGASASFSDLLEPTFGNEYQNVKEDSIISSTGTGFGGSSASKGDQGCNGIPCTQSMWQGELESTSVSIGCTLNQQSVHKILEVGFPSHLNSVFTENNLITGPGKYILRIPATGQGNNTQDRYFINPTALYHFSAQGGRGQGRAPESCLASSRREGHIFYSSGIGTVKRIEQSVDKEEAGANNNYMWWKVIQKAFAGIRPDSYSLTIHAGGEARTFSMPLYYSLFNWSIGLTVCNKPPEEMCAAPEDYTNEDPLPLYATSPSSFPAPSFSITLFPAEYWEYDDGEGNPIYNKATGEQLRDPVTGQSS